MTLTELQPRISLVSTAFKLTLGIHFILLLLEIYSIDFFSGINEGDYVSDGDLDTYTNVTVVCYGAAFMIFIFTAVAFVRWMLGIFDFNERHGMRHPFERSYVAWAFFIPFINLVRPYQAVSGLMSGSLHLANGNDDHPLMRFLLPWWLAYISGNILSQISQRMITNTDSIDVYITSFYLDCISTVLALVSAFLIFRVVESHQEVLEQGQLVDQIELIGEDSEEEERW